MSAQYTSPKPDGYCKTRNHVYREREMALQARIIEQQAPLKDMPAQTKANYGKKS